MEYQLLTPSLPLNKELSVVEQVLANRGIFPVDVYHYINTTDEDILPPSLIMNMREGSQILIKHVSQNDKVLIQIDSDCDGYTSAATLINYLNCLFPGFVQNNVFIVSIQGNNTE